MTGPELAVLRKAKGWSQAKLATEAGLGPAERRRISDFETGRRNMVPMVATLFKLLLAPPEQ